ncbi:MAG TPA: PP2C family protein-serine/threonine phosphatase [Acidobacteriota bacterium]|nr:PP2C family protein-serine/threonine phosphatase [Acidobacteriota bacterium]
MDKEVADRVRDSLVEQRDRVEKWLQDATPEEKQARLGPFAESAVQQHLDVLDGAATKAEQNTLGICVVCQGEVELSRLEVDYTANVCIEDLTDTQRRNLEKELQLSQKVQKALLPQQIPNLPGLELAAFSQPARIVGGDYFDFFQFKDGSPGLVIADVMGKGVGASLLMASLQASLRILVTEEDDPCEVIRRLNQLFLHNINLTKFVTLFLARYDASSRTLYYCNAGHNPPVLVRNNESRWVQSTSAAIGLIENFDQQGDRLVLRQGDLLLLYTDGVTEAHNASEEEFGDDRLAEVVTGNASLPARDLLTAIRRAIQQFTTKETPEDDTTIVAVKVVA